MWYFLPSLKSLALPSSLAYGTSVFGWYLGTGLVQMWQNISFLRFVEVDQNALYRILDAFVPLSK